MTEAMPQAVEGDPGQRIRTVTVREDGIGTRLPRSVAMNVAAAVVMGMGGGRRRVLPAEMRMSRSMPAMFHQAVQRRIQADGPGTDNAQCQKGRNELMNPFHCCAANRIGLA